MDVNSLKPLATTGPKRRCPLLPREVVLFGGGNSDKGGKEGGSFFSPFLFSELTIPVDYSPRRDGYGYGRKYWGKG